MSAVVLAMSMSLDGFVTGPNATIENPLGDGGERLHDWIFPVAETRVLEGEGGVTHLHYQVRG